MKAFTTSVLLLLALTACGPTEAPEVMPTVPPGIDPITGQTIDLTPGLNDREPDTCHAADYMMLMGQPEASVAAAGIMRPTRIVPLNGIVSQQEYDSFRINFHLDATGNIAQINCG